MTTPNIRLGEVCAQDRAAVRAGDRPELRYLGLESIESQSGALVTGELSKTPDAPEANSFIFTADHVLYGKLRPYLNKVYVPDLPGKCSTELVPLRPTNRLTREYLAYFLRAPSTVEKISTRVAGARMPRADMTYVMSLPIPLPSLTEQHRIVNLLSRAAGIVRMRREAEQKAREIIPALFLDMFGDPATNPRGWGVRTVGDVIDSAQYGSNTKASAEGAGVPMIRMGNVDFAGRLSLRDLKYVELSPSDLAKYGLRDGDILFNRTNSKDLVGKTGIWRGEQDAVAASYFIRVRADETLIVPNYFWAFMNCRQTKEVLFGMARGAIGQSNINVEELRGIRIPVPPLKLQQSFGQRAVRALELDEQQSRATAQSESAFQSLLARVFSQ